MPGLGEVPVFDGDWSQRADVAGDVRGGPAPSRPLPAENRGWMPLMRTIAGDVAGSVESRPPRVMVATGSVILSTTGMALGAQVSPGVVLDVVATHGERSRADFGGAIRARAPDAALTADAAGTREAAVPAAKPALREAGFRVVRRYAAPDGRAVRLWERR